MVQESAKRKWIVWLPFLLSLVLVIGVVIGMRMPSSEPAIRMVTEENLGPNSLGRGKLEELIRYIEAKYVDPVDREEMLNNAIAAIMGDLDPHSNYYSTDEALMVKENLEGKFDGIGIEFMILEDTIVVLDALVDGPSYSAGIRAGDKLVMIEDSLVAGVGITSSGIMDHLRGEKGSEVQVTVIDGDSGALQEYSITRDRIPTSSLEAAFMINDKTGMIKLSRFTAQTYEDFMQALEGLVEQEGLEHLIIDLRQNPGGYLQETTQILSQLFRDAEKLLVYTEGRSSPRKEFETTGRPFFDVERIVVLIDENSASASEILAGAIQDNDRGIVVGRRSFGKGLVQERYSLSDGSEIHLTVARYYTPSGRSIQKSYTDRDHYGLDLADRYTNGELIDRDSIKVVDSTIYYTTGGRQVFGGGGITPDVFVPIDTSLLKESYLILRQEIPGFTFRFLEGKRSQYIEMGFEEFQRRFRIDAEIWNTFLDYAAPTIEKYELGDDQIEEVATYLRRDLQSRIARHIYGKEEFYRLETETDPDIAKALELVTSPEEQWQASSFPNQ